LIGPRTADIECDGLPGGEYMNEKLSPNMEMYLKTILRLERDDAPVRVKSIADSLGVTMPSVSEAIRNLKSKGLVEHVSYGKVRLSANGRGLAGEVDERFRSLRRFLVEVLKIDDTVAETEACEIEHVVGQETLGRLSSFLEWVKHHRPEDVDSCINGFHLYLEKLSEGDIDEANRLLLEGQPDMN
jgi:DtxR family Mn-dependent transcriptional regulator